MTMFGGGGKASLTPWNTATFTKPDVTVAGSSGAWTTANTGMTIFTITGQVLLRCYGIVTTTLTSTSNTGTITLTTTGGGNIIGTGTANNSTNLLTGYVWASGAASTANPMNNASFAVANATTLTLTIATNNMTAGGMTIYCEWIGINGGTVTAATP